MTSIQMVYVAAKTIVKQCLHDSAIVVFDDRAYYKLIQVSLSDSTINSRMVEISNDIKIQFTWWLFSVFESKNSSSQ